MPHGEVARGGGRARAARHDALIFYSHCVAAGALMR
jgi:hypothetical protein